MATAFDLEAARRLPLADAALRLLDYLTDDAFLAAVYDRHRGRAYEGAVAFPLLVHLVAEALLGHRGSAHQAFRRAQAAGDLGATVQAMDRKLGRLPVGLSLGFFAAAAERLRAVAPAAVAEALPDSPAAFRVLGFDGKKVQHAAKRLKPLRGPTGDAYGGKLLVVQDLATRQAVAAAATADGEGAGNPLVPDAVARVRALPDGRPRLWVGDRAFCDYPLLGRLAAAPDHFLVRFNRSCGFHPGPAVPAKAGADAAGRAYREEWGWLGQPDNPDRIRVRRISPAEPAGDPLILVTGLLDADAYPAADPLGLSRRRWGLEVMFHRVAQTFGLRHVIGGRPRATVFRAALRLLLYNVTLAVRDHVAVGAGRPPAEVSLGLPFDDLVRDLTAWLQVIPPGATIGVLRATPLSGPDAFRRHPERTLGAVWTGRWAKAPTRPRPPRARPRAYTCGGHTSVEEVLRGEHQEVPLDTGPKGPRPTATPPPPFEAKKHV